MTTFTATARTAVARVREISRELGDAQRRMFEIRTGVSVRPTRTLSHGQ